MIKHLFFALVLLCFLSFITNCSTPVFRLFNTHKSYVTADTIQSAIGTEMVSVDRITNYVVQGENVNTANATIFRTTLTYTGRSGSVIKLSYREYTTGNVDKDIYIRPAYSIALEYDLAESEYVMFRGLRMKVLEATNTSITFVVMEDGEWQSSDAV